jgi:hypothetical protein
VTKPVDDETPLPGPVPHHEADPSVPSERLPPETLDDEDAADALDTLDPDADIATRPHQKLDPASGLFERPGSANEFDDEKTPPPRFLRRAGSELDQTLPRDRHLADDDDT